MGRKMVFLYLGLAFLLLTSFSGGAVLADGGDLLTNPGFEEGFKDWSIWKPAGEPVIEIDPSVSHSGRASARISGDGVVRGCIYRDVINVLEVGGAYSIEAWLKTENVAGGSGALLRLEFYDKDNQMTRPHLFLGKLSGNNDWTKISQAFAIPEGTVRVTVSLFLESASGTVWWDDIRLTRDEKTVFKIETIGASVLPSGTVKVEWEIPSLFAEGNKYQVYRGGTSDFSTGDRPPIGIVDTLSFIDRNTSQGSQYFYKVIAIRPNGQESPVSLPVGVSVREVSLPQPPSVAYADWREEGISLCWSLPEDTRARNVKIERLELEASRAPGEDRWQVVAMLPGWMDRYIDGGYSADIDLSRARYRFTVIDPDGKETTPVEVKIGSYIPQIPKAEGADRHPFLFITKQEIEELQREAMGDSSLASVIKGGILEPAQTAFWRRKGTKIGIPPKNGSGHEELACDARNVALGYAFSGNLEMAQVAKEILLAYADKYRTYPLKLAYDGHVLYQTLNESMWLIPLVWAYDLILDSGILSDEQRRHIEEDLFREAVRTIDRYDMRLSNWQAWHNAAMGAVAFVLKDEKLIDEVLTGSQGFIHHIGDDAMRGDGLWWEQIGYHAMTREALTYLAEMAYRQGYDLYSFMIHGKSFKLMFDAPFYASFSNLRLPTIGTTGYHASLDFDWTYGLAAMRYRDPNYAWLFRESISRSTFTPELIWLPLAFYSEAIRGIESPEEFCVTTGTFGTAGRNLLGSTLMTDTGLVLLRGSAWQPGGPEVSLVYKAHGCKSGHESPDNLTITLNALGRVWVPGPGNYSYSDPRQGSWYRQTVACNGVVVDEESQYPQGLAYSIWLWDQDHISSGQLQGFVATTQAQFASCSTGNVYTDVDLGRSVLVASPYVIDLYRVSSEKAHQYDWVIHVDADESNQSIDLVPKPSSLGKRVGYEHISDLRVGTAEDTWQAAWSQDGQRFSVTMLGEPGTTVIRGTGFGQNPDARRNPLVVVRRNAKETEFVSVMEACEGEPKVKAVRRIVPATTGNGPGSSGNAIEILREGGKDIFAWRDCGPGEMEVTPPIELPGGYIYQGEYAFFGGDCSTEGSRSRCRVLLLVNGREIRCSEMEVVTPVASSIGLERLGDGTFLLVNTSSGFRRVEVRLEGRNFRVFELDGDEQVRAVPFEKKEEAEEGASEKRSILSWQAKPYAVYLLSEREPEPKGIGNQLGVRFVKQ